MFLIARFWNVRVGKMKKTMWLRVIVSVMVSGNSINLVTVAL